MCSLPLSSPFLSPSLSRFLYLYFFFFFLFLPLFFSSLNVYFVVNVYSTFWFMVDFFYYFLSVNILSAFPWYLLCVHASVALTMSRSVVQDSSTSKVYLFFSVKRKFFTFSIILVPHSGQLCIYRERKKEFFFQAK